MGTKERHIIHRQILEVDLPDEENTFHIQRRINALYKDKVLPKLEKLFNDIELGSTILQIPYLEIDIGDVQLNHLENEFVDRLVDLLEMQLKEELGRATQKVSKTGKLIPTSTSFLNSFLTFLTTGNLPPIHQHLLWPNIETEIMKVFRDDSNYSKKMFGAVLNENENAVYRLMNQFSENFQFELFKVLQESPSQLTEKASSTIDQMEEIVETYKKVPVFPLTNSNNLVEDFRQKEGQIIDWIEKHLKKNGLSNYEKRKIRTLFFQIILYLPKEKQLEFLQHTFIKQFSATSNKLDEETISLQFEQLSTKTPIYSSKEASFTSGDDLPKPETNFNLSKKVSFAGLTLLHPFLPNYFKYLNLVEKGKFISREAQERCLHLLHFLATGTFEPFEHLLGVPKLLCYWPRDMPVAKEIELTELELKESEDLLNAVINHWAVLKSTSIGGLREAFLKRGGLLSFNSHQNHWQLQIERKGQDILLDKLSWGYGVIKLPWMQEQLIVEW